jgi:hypothetical protein
MKKNERTSTGSMSRSCARLRYCNRSSHICACGDCSKNWKPTDVICKFPLQHGSVYGERREEVHRLQVHHEPTSLEEKKDRSGGSLRLLAGSGGYHKMKDGLHEYESSMRKCPHAAIPPIARGHSRPRPLYRMVHGLDHQSQEYQNFRTFH